MKKISRSSRERGSALLIVFVMAAMIAIMLYMEMPVSVFEAQRNKEQLLIDRGNEYAHAAKLYVRKMGQYPPTLEALENTNRMRFLRKRYKDPFTGKDNWRLLHAAPNGILTDSKVKSTSTNNNIAGVGNGNNAGIGNSNSNTNNQNAGNSPFGGSTSPFSSSSNSPFSNNSSPFSSQSSSGFGGFNSNSSQASSGFGGFNSGNSNSSSSSGGDVVVPALPQRRPTIAANGGANGVASQEMSAMGAENGAFNAGSLAPVPSGNADPNTQANTGQVPANGQVAPGQNGTNASNSSPMNHGPVGNQNTTAINPGGSSFGLTTSNSGTGSSSGLGVMQGGGGGVGIAGVASIAKGHSIKTVNDQDNYSLWEFYYDPTKDTVKAAAGTLAQMGGGQTGGLGQSTNSTTNSSNTNSFGGGVGGTQNSFGGGGFGQQSNTNSGFGNSGFGQSSNTNSGFGSFGNSGTNNNSNGFGNSSQTTPTNTPTNPQQQ